jgi:AcrR family transcriptional regulator
MGSSRYLPPVANPKPEAEQASGLPRLPPGRHGLPREFVAQNQRDRIAAGIIAAVSEFGYHETTITQISAAAGVSRRTFYGYFNSKEECYFSTYDQITDHLREAAGAAAAGREDWPARVAARIDAALDVFATNPRLAAYTLAVPRRAGGEVTAHYRQALDCSLAELTADLPAELEGSVPSDAVKSALIGGVASLIVQRLEAGEGSEIRSLGPELVELFLTPFVGPAEAAVAAAGAGR